MSKMRTELTHQAETLARQRASVTTELKDVAAALWRDGLKNVRELGRLTGLSRTTLYDALRERGIEPTDRTATESDLRYAELPQERRMLLRRQQENTGRTVEK